MSDGKKEFSTVDYVIFSCTLLVSAGIGVYYGCTGGRQRTTSEFLMANRRMQVLPVALSLLASFMSAITLLGTPAELYTFGTMYMWIGVSYLGVIPISAHVFIPIFHKLRLTSAYEYLERRFNYIVRAMGSVTFIIQMVVYMSIVLLAPALALNTVTGLNVLLSVMSIGLVCTFYTTVGGMKAVMWTDVFQICMMFAGMIAVVVQGSLEVGGFANVWELNRASGRVEFDDFAVTPFRRHTVWSLAIGGVFTWVAIYGVNQAQVQRALTVPTLRHAQLAMWINLPGLFFLMFICSLAGMVIYAVFEKCDPQTSGHIQAKDQLLPFFVMQNLSHLPGVPGLFVACLFSGALSTISSGLNSLAAVTLEDILKRNRYIKSLTDERHAIISKVLAISYGVMAILLTFVARELGGVLEAALAIFGMVGGPLLGLFCLGVFFRWANSLGAGVGLLTGLAFSFWFGIGAKVQKPFVMKKPISVSECVAMFNLTDFNVTDADINVFEPPARDEDVLLLYKLSYMWYSAWGCLAVVIVGLAISLATGGMKQEIDPRLIYNVADNWLCCLPESIKQKLRCGVKFDEAHEYEEREFRNKGIENYTLDEKAQSGTVSHAAASTDELGKNGIVMTKC